MSLLPKSRQIQDDLTPLGKLVAREIAPAPVDEIERFNKRQFSVLLPSGFSTFISEKDCRQIKWAVTPASREVAPIARPAEAAPPSVPAVDAPRFKVGDRVTTTESHRHETWVLKSIRMGGLFKGEWNAEHDGVTGILNPERMTLAPPATLEADGWIEWKGGKCPIPAGTPFQYRLKSQGDDPKHTAPDGRYQSGILHDPEADFRGWGAGSTDQITAYRVVKPS